MTKTVLGLAVSVLASAAWPAFAQAPPQAPPQAPRQPVMVTTIVQRPEMRVIRVSIQPNATRTLHAHADSQFHLFMPLDGTIDVTIDGEPTEHLGPWQAHVFKGGTMHAFTNPSAGPVQWLEVFVLKTAAAAGLDADQALSLAVASLSSPPAP